MAEVNERIHRLLTEEIDECCDDDIEEKARELAGLRSSIIENNYQEDLQVLSTLASETRYKIIRVLVSTQTELCVCELDALFDVSESAISHALSRLHDAGLVERRKQGKWRYYTATRSASSLINTLNEIQGDSNE